MHWVVASHRVPFTHFVVGQTGAQLRAPIDCGQVAGHEAVFREDFLLRVGIESLPCCFIESFDRHFQEGLHLHISPIFEFLFE